MPARYNSRALLHSTYKSGTAIFIYWKSTAGVRSNRISPHLVARDEEKNPDFVGVFAAKTVTAMWVREYVCNLIDDRQLFAESKHFDSSLHLDNGTLAKKVDF